MVTIVTESHSGEGDEQSHQTPPLVVLVELKFNLMSDDCYDTYDCVLR